MDIHFDGYLDPEFAREFSQRMHEMLRGQHDGDTPSSFSHALAPHPLSFSGIPTFYLLLPSAPMHRQLDPEHEEKILENIKKIIEYMYSSVGLPEQRSVRESVDEPTLSPEAAGLDLKRLTFVKKLIEKGVFSEFPSE